MSGGRALAVGAAVLLLVALAVWRRPGGVAPSAPAAPPPPISGERQGPASVPASAPPSIPSASPAASRPGEDARVLMGRLLDLARAGRARHRRSVHQTRGEREILHRHREARLFALAYGADAEREAAAVLRDSARPEDDRSYALLVLKSRAAEAGSRGAEDAILAAATGSEASLARIALADLAEIDPEGRYRGLHRAKAGQGVPEAVEALGSWPDAESERVLERLVSENRGKPHPEGALAGFAEEALERLALLKRPDAAGALLSIAAGEDRGHPGWTEWALGQLKARGLDGRLPEAAAGRLRTAEEKAAGARGGVLLEAHVADPAFARWAGDPAYDDVLIALHRAGGTPSGRQALRLRLLGYGADPAALLADFAR